MSAVVAVHRDASHRFSKVAQDHVELVVGHGIVGDAHAGATVKHRSRVRRDPSAPNLRQVHLLHAELFDEVARAGHLVAPGDLGENVTTLGVDLLALPTGARLHLGDHAVVEVTGLRNPCRQIDHFQDGLLRHVVGPGADGELVRETGVMAVVVEGGTVRPDDAVRVVLPDGPHVPLAPV